MKYAFNKLKQYLRRPHPFFFDFKMALGIGIIVFLFLFLFQPLDMSSLNLSDKLFMCTGFGIIAAVGVWGNYWFFKRLIPHYFNEDKWTILSEILYSIYVVIFLGFINTIFIISVNDNSPPFIESLIEVQLHTFLISIVPILIIVFVDQNRALKKQLVMANKLTQSLDTSDPMSQSRKLFLFQNETGKPEIKLPLHQVLFIRAEGNYIEIFYINEDGNETKYLIRQKLKALKDELPPSKFFHVHRSYVINGDYIERINGNARSYLVTLRGSSSEIPVARSKVDSFQKFILSLNSSNSHQPSPIHT